MKPERTPQRMCEDLVRQMVWLMSLDESRPKGLSRDRIENMARAITRSIFRAGNRWKDRRGVARLVAEVAVALERYLSRTGDPNFSYAPTLAMFIRYVMEGCLELPQPGDGRIRRCLSRLMRAMEMPQTAAAVGDTYEQIVRLYRLRPEWSVVLGLSWLFV